MSKKTKTYIISLARSQKRRRYILKHAQTRKLDYTLVEAVDGQLLTEEDIARHCLVDHIRKHPEFFSSGMLGCALSHYKAYQVFVDSGEPFGFFLEDDAYLPKDINALLPKITAKMNVGEAVLLYFDAIRKIKVSTLGRETIDKKVSYCIQ